MLQDETIQIVNQTLQELDPQGIQIYTDGSKSNNSVGSAYVIPELNTQKGFKLLIECSIFSAEAVAIISALHYIQNSDSDKQIFYILTDSKSVLLAIQGNLLRPSTNWLVFDIKTRIFKIQKSGKRCHSYGYPHTAIFLVTKKPIRQQKQQPTREKIYLSQFHIQT
jgi:ribonuclease HI